MTDYRKTINPHQKTFEPQTTTWDPFTDLRNMHDKFGFSSQVITKEQMKARLDFIQEELDEAYEALRDNNADDFVDANIDIMVVAIGNLDQGGVNGWQAWDAVHSANMAKVTGNNNKRPGMKQDLVKPEGWKKPSHANNIGILTEIFLRDEEFKANGRSMSDLRRRAIEHLQECQVMMLKKANDYNFPGSRVKSADYYPRGLDDLEHMLHTKMLRIMSLIDKMKAGEPVENESLVDSLRDMVVFSAMMAEFSEGKMDGQDPAKDLFGGIKK
jgi:hypothetical protein